MRWTLSTSHFTMNGEAARGALQAQGEQGQGKCVHPPRTRTGTHQRRLLLRHVFPKTQLILGDSWLKACSGTSPPPPNPTLAPRARVLFIQRQSFVGFRSTDVCFAGSQVQWATVLFGCRTFTSLTPQGGRPVLVPDPPPPSPLQTPPKFSNPSFPNLRFWGKGLAPKAPKIFLFPFLRGFFFTRCVYTQNTQNFVENSKMFEKHRKFLTPDLTSGSDLG